MQAELERLLNPRHIAVVGASPVSAPGRYEYVRWFLEVGFSGTIYPVNPRYEEVHGLTCYPSLKDIPGEVDLAFMMVPAEMAVETLREVPPGKVNFVAVISSGFSELGEAELERELVEVARARGMRVLGPNCMGLYCRRTKLLQVSDQPMGTDPGELAILGQSGGNSVNMVRASLNSGVTANCAVAVGNQGDLCLEDFLERFDSDDDIKLIAAYVEDFKAGRRFIELARDISLRKPIIVWKGGITGEGARAAASHTGALGVPKGIWKGVFRQTGIIPADDVRDVINFSRALLWQTTPQGPGVGLMSPGGGSSVLMTDRSVEAGLRVPVLSLATRRELSRHIAKVNTILDNPIDLGAASYQPETIQKTIRAMAKEESIHSFIFHLHVYPFRGKGPRELLPHLVSAIKEVQGKVNKPIYVALYAQFYDVPEADEARREAIEFLQEAKIPYAEDLACCARMVKRMWEYSRYLQGRARETEGPRRVVSR